jgi:hypothetical protein
MCFGRMQGSRRKIYSREVERESLRLVETSDLSIAQIDQYQGETT